MARKSQAQLEREIREDMERTEAAAQKLLDKRLPEIVATIMAAVQAQQAALGGAAAIPGGELRSFASALGTTIARASDPKNARVIVAPEIQAERDAARTAMVNLLVKLKAERVWPLYLVKSTCFLNHRLIEPQWRDEGTKKMHPTKIKWDKAPNEAMVPDPADPNAVEVYRLYKQSMGNGQQVEGMPPPPWISGAQEWINTTSGAVLGRPIETIPEIQAGEAAWMDDPRVAGQGGVKPTEVTHVLGTIAAPVVNTSFGVQN